MFRLRLRQWAGRRRPAQGQRRTIFTGPIDSLWPLAPRPPSPSGPSGPTPPRRLRAIGRDLIASAERFNLRWAEQLGPPRPRGRSTSRSSTTTATTSSKKSASSAPAAWPAAIFIPLHFCDPRRPPRCSSAPARAANSADPFRPQTPGTARPMTTPSRQIQGVPVRHGRRALRGPNRS